MERGIPIELEIEVAERVASFHVHFSYVKCSITIHFAGCEDPSQALGCDDTVEQLDFDE